MAPNSWEFYPSGRDAVIKSAEQWMDTKRDDDNLGKGIWRIHDKIYNLTEFASKHPGGRFWIEETEGTDITEAFESAHVTGDGKAEALLAKYCIGVTKSPRKSGFTFKEDGFYRTLKRRVSPVLKEVGTGPTRWMLAFQDTLSISALLLMSLGAYLDSSLLMAIAGFVLGMSTSCSHNFFHQKDNWRRYYWDLSLLSSRDWRITHGMSHHLFPNTFNDFEISALEPFLFFLPNPDKTWLVRFGTQIIAQILPFIVFHLEFFRRFLLVCILRTQKFRPEYLLPVLELLAMLYLNSASSFWRVYWLWVIVHAWCSWWFVATSVTASHHHPHIYHAGDEPRADKDWGLHQVDATRDVIGKRNHFFLVATTFGNHTLHHLFPTVDQSKIPFLYPALEQTCKEFGVKYEPRSTMDLLVGTHQQLARNFPTTCSIENGRMPLKSTKKD